MLAVSRFSHIFCTFCSFRVPFHYAGRSCWVYIWVNVWYSENFFFHFILYPWNAWESQVKMLQSNRYPSVHWNCVGKRLMRNRIFFLVITYSRRINFRLFQGLKPYAAEKNIHANSFKEKSLIMINNLQVSPGMGSNSSKEKRLRWWKTNLFQCLASIQIIPQAKQKKMYYRNFIINSIGFIHFHCFWSNYFFDL